MQRILLFLVLLTGLFYKGAAQSLDFDGTDDYVVIPPSTGINSQFTGNAITLEGWFYPTQAPGGFPMLIGESYLGDGNILFCMYLNGTTLYGGFFDGGWHTVTTTIALNTWQHIACTYDQANLKIYVNGVLAVSQTETNSLPAGTEEWRLGLRWDLPDYYQGKMDEVRIWNTANSQAQILDNMNCSLSSPQANLIANYNFNEGVPNGNNAAVGTLTDISGNSIDGALTNFALSGASSNWSTNVNTLNPPVTASITASATTINSGAPVTFTATAVNGGSSPVFQWMLNGSPVGSNSNIYVSDTLADKDTLSCIVTSSMVCAAAVGNSNKIGMTVEPNNGSSLSFDGVDDYVSAGIFTTSVDNITLEAWVKWNGSTGANQLILNNGNTGNAGYSIFLNSSTGNDVNILCGGIVVMSSGYVLTPFAWTHIAVTRDAGTWNLYIDGVAQPLSSNSATPAPVSGLFTIGSNQSGAENFSGSIDEVRVWDLARTQNQIQGNMFCSLPAEGNLIANYNFDEGTPNANNAGVTTLSDISGNGYDGTLSNFALNGTSSNWVGNIYTLDPLLSVNVTASMTSLVPGTSVTFTATAVNGGPTPFYQWMVNGVMVGSNSNTFSSNTLSDHDTITCVVTSSIICATLPATSNKTGVSVSDNNGASLDFDGADDYITTGIDANPAAMPSTTWEGWIYPTTNDANWRMVLANEDGGWDRFIALNGGGIYIGVTTGGWNPASYQINTWQHMAVVFEPGNVRFYLNGVEYNYGTDEGSHSASGTFTIGANQVGIQHFQGSMDEVRIWNVARTQAEIQGSMFCALSAQTNLVANYHFNDGVPNANNAGLTTLSDKSGNNYDGTLLNFALNGTSSNWVGDINTLDPSMSVTISASMTTIFPGTAVTFTATAVNGGSTPSYQWMVNGAMVGTNSDIFSSNTLSDHDTITCMVTSSITCASTMTANSNKIGISVSLNNGSSLNFDGNDDYVDIGNVIPAGSSYTKEIWVYAASTSCNNILSSGDDPMYLTSGYLAAGNGGNYNYVMDPNPFPINTWTHTAVTYDASTSTMTLYVNGVSVASGSGAPAYSGAPTTYIGRHTGGCFFLGNLDEVRVWNVARTQAQIIDNMNCSIPAQANLLAYYDFNEGMPNGNNAASTTLYDNSGNNYDGPLSNFALSGTQSNYVEGVNTLNPVPSVVINATATTLCAGMGATFTATSTYGGATPSYQWMLNGSPVGTDSDTYSASILADQDSITCVLSSSISCASVVNSNKIGITITPIDTTVSVAGNALTVGSAIGTYQWIDCSNTTPINGETNQTFIAPSNGTYSVTVTIGACAATSQCVTISSTGVNSMVSENVEVYPNPSTGNFTVTINTSETASLQVFDVMGKLVLSQNVQDGKNLVNAENLNEGVYVLTISQNQRKSTRKLTITK